MCDLGLEDTATIWNVTYPRARVEHLCACCRRAIPRGDYYALTRSLFDGHWTTEKACAGCATVINAFGEEHRFYPSADGFVEYLEECARDDVRWAPVLAAIAASRYPQAAS